MACEHSICHRLCRLCARSRSSAKGSETFVCVPVRRHRRTALLSGFRARRRAEAAAMARPWVLAAAVLWLAALAHSPRGAALAATPVSGRGSVGGTALLENAKNCVFMFQARLRCAPRSSRFCTRAKSALLYLRVLLRLTDEPWDRCAQGAESYTYMLQARRAVRPRRASGRAAQRCFDEQGWPCARLTRLAARRAGSGQPRRVLHGAAAGGRGGVHVLVPVLRQHGDLARRPGPPGRRLLAQGLRKQLPQEVPRRQDARVRQRMLGDPGTRPRWRSKA